MLRSYLGFPLPVSLVRLWYRRPPSHLQSAGVPSTPHSPLSPFYPMFHCTAPVSQNGSRLPGHEHHPVVVIVGLSGFFYTQSTIIRKHGLVI
jgi:hypothetical protein